jgi:hypothetical protein
MQVSRQWLSRVHEVHCSLRIAPPGHRAGHHCLAPVHHVDVLHATVCFPLFHRHSRPQCWAATIGTADLPRLVPAAAPP